MPSNLPPSGSAPRTRTASELKWLLNERAALAGRLENLHEAEAKQRLLVAAAEALLAKRRAHLAEVERCAADAEAKLQALGQTIALGYPDVPPDSAGTVKARTRFGQRGALIAFLLQAVTDAGEAGLSTGRLTDLVRDAFGVPTADRAERQALLSTVRNRLKELRDLHGLVVGVRGPASTSDTIWRLRPTPSLSELQQLRAIATAAEATDDFDSHPDAL